MLSLFQTGRTLNIPGLTEKELPIFQTREKELYIYFETDIGRKFVRPILWNNNPCKLDDYHGSEISETVIGEERSFFRIIEMDLEEFLREVDDDPAAEVARIQVEYHCLKRENSELKRKVKQLEEDLSKVSDHTLTVSKKVKKLEEALKTDVPF